MPQYRVTFPSNDRPPEVVDAERVDVEGSNGLIVLRGSVLLMSQPRGVVVRR